MPFLILPILVRPLYCPNHNLTQSHIQYFEVKKINNSRRTNIRRVFEEEEVNKPALSKKQRHIELDDDDDEDEDEDNEQQQEEEEEENQQQQRQHQKRRLIKSSKRKR